MRIKTIVTGEIGENAYIINNGKEAIIIDSGADYEKLKKELGELTCVAVLLTHAHYDHIGAAARFQQCGAKIYLHEGDVGLLNGFGNLADMFGEKLESFTPDIILKGDEIIELCGEKIRVLATPGHTEGSVCYIINNVIFSGDTLFNLSVGRTDFPTGNPAKLRDSLKKLFSLEGEYTVLPGHNLSTTLMFEKNNNPYV